LRLAHGDPVFAGWDQCHARLLASAEDRDQIHDAVGRE
jgi:hypothetical protein